MSVFFHSWLVWWGGASAQPGDRTSLSGGRTGVSSSILKPYGSHMPTNQWQCSNAPHMSDLSLAYIKNLTTVSLRQTPLKEGAMQCN